MGRSLGLCSGKSKSRFQATAELIGFYWICKTIDWAKNDIDYFILQKLKEKKLPSPQADKATLLRRVSLDYWHACAR